MTIQELLKKHIENNGYSIYQIAGQSGMNRSSLQKVLSGQRRLTDDMYEEITSFLALSPTEKAECDRAFMIDKIGDKRYLTHMEIMNMLELPKAFFYNQQTDIYENSDLDMSSLPEQLILHDRFRIMNLFYHIICLETEKESEPYVYTFLDMGSRKISSMLSVFCNSRFKELSVVHLLEFNKSADMNGNYDNVHNIEVLTNLLPFFAAFEGKYTIRYYYCNDYRYSDSAVALPYYVISNNYVIQLSADLSTAVFISDKEIHKHYVSTFNRLMTSSALLTSNPQSPVDMLDTLSDVSPMDQSPSCINIQPTLEMFITADMVDKYIKDIPYKDVIRAKLLERINQLKQIGNHTIFFTQEGLELFALHGKNVNFPDSMGEHFDIPDRISILKKIISSNDTEKHPTHLLLDKTRIDTSSNFICVSVAPPKFTYIMMSQMANPYVIPISDNSICHAMYDFLQTLPEYNLSLSMEDTNAVLREYINKLEKQLR